jgi:REP element-mobilizing transposase RayT
VAERTNDMKPSLPPSTSERAVPLAYLITFTCYGTHLHGDEEGSVDRGHNIPRTPHLLPNPDRMRTEQMRMQEAAYAMDASCRSLVLRTLVEVSAHRGWSLLAAHVRTNHVHVVIHGDAAPERVMNDFKSYISRRLNEQGFDDGDRRRWTRHGSTRYLWRPEHVEAAIHYVVHEQGEPMAVFEDKERVVRHAP